MTELERTQRLLERAMSSLENAAPWYPQRHPGFDEWLDTRDQLRAEIVALPKGEEVSLEEQRAEQKRKHCTCDDCTADPDPPRDAFPTLGLLCEVVLQNASDIERAGMSTPELRLNLSVLRDRAAAWRVKEKP